MVIMINSIDLAHFITNRFGLPVLSETKQVPEGQKLVIRPSEVPQTIGFSVEFVIGWRSLEAKFVPGRFAAELVEAMRTADLDKKAAFKVFAEAAQAKSAQIHMTVSGKLVDPVAPENWPNGWGSFELLMRKSAIVLDPNDAAGERETIYPWAARFFGMILALLPLESTEQPPLTGEEEGAVYEAKVRRYERSRINRAACIEIHGLYCVVCHLLFSERYGEIGESFIHVHHVVPVSMMGGSYVVNPATDLVPVCPNCHAMLHSRTPPLSVDQLKTLLA